MTSQETQGSPFYPQKERQVKECEMGNSSHNAVLFRIHFLQWSTSKSYILHPFKQRKQLFIFLYIFFSFSPRTLLSNTFNLLFHYLLPFFRQLRNSIFPKFFSFLSKELFQVPFTVLQGIEIFSIEFPFPLQEFCKD